MKEKLISIKGLISKLTKEIKKLEVEIGPINQEISSNEIIINGKQELLNKKTSELEKIKENKLIKLLLSPKFHFIPIGITCFLTMLSLIFSTALLAICAIIFGLSYICSNAIAINVLKKDLPEVILEKISLEYSDCVNEISKLNEEIEYLNRTNKKLVTNNRTLINELDSKRKELESLILPFLVELIVKTADKIEKEDPLTANQLLEIIVATLQLPTIEEKTTKDKVFSIGTMPGSGT